MTGNHANTALRRGWRLGLVVVIALLYAWIGLSAGGPGLVAGVGGAVLVVAVTLLGSRSRAAAIALLLVGAVPLAVLTWWSLVTPLLALLCLVLGWPRTAPTTPPMPAVRS